MMYHTQPCVLFHSFGSQENKALCAGRVFWFGSWLFCRNNIPVPAILTRTCFPCFRVCFIEPLSLCLTREVTWKQSATQIWGTRDALPPCWVSSWLFSFCFLCACESVQTWREGPRECSQRVRARENNFLPQQLIFFQGVFIVKRLVSVSQLWWSFLIGKKSQDDSLCTAGLTPKGIVKE